MPLNVDLNCPCNDSEVVTSVALVMECKPHSFVSHNENRAL